MQVLRAEEMGMCFGVRDALKILDDVRQPETVTIHGELVHNEAVLTQLGVRGFRMAAEQQRDTIPTTDTVLITAHGISDRERARLEAASKRLIDTTCPLVVRVHQAALSLQREGFHVLMIGKPDHVEVRGIVEDLNSYDVVPTPSDARTYSSPKLAVICQTTVAPRMVAAIHSAIFVANPTAEIRFVDTTCQPTRNRQRSVEKLIPFVQAMVVVGGRNSNNTRELADLCRQRGLKTFHVQGVDDLQPDWFRGIECVGLTAGTSTLDATIREVQRRLSMLPFRALPPQPPSKLRSPEREHSQWWCDYYARNLQRLLPLNWDQGAALSDEQRAVLIPSLQDFQLGESSEGRHGLALAAHYGEKAGDPQYVETVRMFFAEENRHAGMLKRYLELNGATTIQHSWTDFIFRRIRHLMGLETLIVVLLTAELIGKVFYRAVREATGCALLRRICTQILRDEQMHLRFHIERLRIMRRDRGRLRRWFGNTLHRLLFGGACLAVWWKHGAAMRLGGWGFKRFWNDAWRELRTARYGIDEGRAAQATQIDPLAA